MTNVAYETVLPGRHQIGTVGAIRLERCADEGWNTRAGSSEYAGRARYPTARCLTITADCGGSNGARVKLWKRELQRFADETGLSISVTHLPLGTSKWNKIEHRLFAFITQNWRGKPLVSHAVIVQLISATTTETGLQVCCEIDPNLYPKGVQVSEQEMQAINLTRAEFHGEWNYTIAPN